MEHPSLNPDLQTARDPSGQLRGRLKIFFGYAPGVGKTSAMLKAAHEARGRGTDVVSGYVEAHASPETLALLGGLEQLPTRMLFPGGAPLCEFDLDAALRRRPGLLLIDELAHANAAGCRHSRRYQDVEELLRAGVDVYATANVQDIESLNDTVSAITGVAVQERIPDDVFDRAEQVELVDIEPSDLIERRRTGANDGLTLEKLTALREIALRRCADRMNRRQDGARGEYRTDERVLVCLSSAPSNARIIRTAARMAAAFHADFTALHVQTPDFAAMSEADRQRLRQNMRLAQQLGAVVETSYGDDVASQIAEFARLSGVSKVVLGRSAAAGARLLRRPTLADRLIAGAPAMDVYIIPDRANAAAYRPGRRRERAAFSWPDLLRSGCCLLGATGLSVAFDWMGFSEANSIMAYLLGVLIASVWTTRRAYSIAASLASVVIFNFLFTEPRFTLLAYNAGYPVTFGIMFLTAYITGTLAARLKNHAKQAAQSAYRTKVLLDAGQLLNRAQGREEILSVLADQLVKLLDRDVVLYPAVDGALSEPRVFPAREGGEAGRLTAEAERSVAQWVLRNNKHAGATTDTLQDAQGLYLAVRVGQRVYAVAGVDARERPLDAFEQGMLLSILGEGALALENERNAREKEAAAVMAKNEQLRANLLRSISHDLRTPLTSISGNASNLMSNSASFDEETKQQLYADIYDDALWLVNLVENLLSVTRIEEGRMSLRLSAELMDEVVAEALQHINRRGAAHEITVSSGEDFLMARIDARLIVQVLVNLVDNAIKYTPPGSHIRISTARAGDRVVVQVADDGPGIAAPDKERVFDMFYSGANRVADSRRSLGLGLSLCRSIVTAHGGAIAVRDNAPHGAIFEFTLPLEEVHLHE